MEINGKGKPPHADEHGKGNNLNIWVNGVEHLITKKELSFDEIVVLAFGEYVPAETKAFTVSYSRGNGAHNECVLVAGQVLKPKKGMIINVGCTNRS